MNNGTPAQPDRAISAVGIQKSYLLGKTRISVLKGVDVEVMRGTSLAILGASGAGKSTLLHILGALDTPDSGTVSIFGEKVSEMGQNRRAYIRATVIGFVFQSYNLLPEMDVLENVVLPSLALPFSSRIRTNARKRALSLIEQVGLADRANHTPPELSGGEQQRVAIARALMNDPSIILADEPTGNLDDETGSQVLGYLFDLSKAMGRTLVIVTHSEKVASRCDKQIKLCEGLAVSK